MHRFVRLATTLIVSILVPGAGAAQDPPVAPEAILDEVFGAPAQLRPSAPGPHWRPGHGTVVWIDDQTAGGSALIEFDPATGDRRVLLDATILAEAWSDIGGDAPAITKPVWRPDGGAILVTGGDRPTLYDFSTRAATVLSTCTGAVQHATFAPDGRRIAWTRDNDLWVFDLELGREVRLTDDGSDTVVNGVFDWVYEEEFHLRDGFRWSPDGERIAYWQLDAEGVGVFYMIDNLAGIYSEVIPVQYPKVGTTNSACRVGCGSARANSRAAASGAIPSWPTRWKRPASPPRPSPPAGRWCRRRRRPSCRSPAGRRRPRTGTPSPPGSAGTTSASGTCATASCATTITRSSVYWPRSLASKRKRNPSRVSYSDTRSSSSLRKSPASRDSLAGSATETSTETVTNFDADARG